MLPRYVVALALLFSASVARAEGPAWQKYTSKAGRFAIELPSKPDEKEQSGMKIVGAEFGTTASDTRTAMCGVTYVKLPAAQADAKTVLEASVARHKQGNTVIEDKDVKVGKHPGKSIIIKNTSHQKWIRSYLVDKKTIYILTCGGPVDRATTDGPIALRVLDSFKITK